MQSRTHVLGISAYYHDSAATLLRDGDIVAAASEERFTRRKGDASFPQNAVAYCLREAGISAANLDFVGFYDKPILKFERILETCLGAAPRGFRQFLKSGPLWVTEKLHTDKLLHEALGYEGEILYAEHHESHAASAFFPSPFEEAAILTMDGVGEWATASYGVGRGNDIELYKELLWPDSLGLLYSAFTYYLGFKVNSGEGKVMGLAPFGKPTFVQQIYDNLIDLKEDGSFRLNQEYFDYVSGFTMTSRQFDVLFGAPPRLPDSRLTQRDMDLASSIQQVCEEVVMRTARTVHAVTAMENLCLAGGVALNCVANGKLLREGPFKELWVQPASGDAGGALGVAQLIWHRHCAKPRHVFHGKDAMKGAYLGPRYSDDTAEIDLKAAGAVYRRLDRTELLASVAQLLATDQIVGWFNGRMEFGPRSLGSRSILADPRSTRMQSHLNLEIKFREGFRPFAPSVLRERVRDWFDLECDSPYMLLVAQVREAHRIPMTSARQQLTGLESLTQPRSDIPAVTHIDYSARIQTVARDISPDFYDLIREFEKLTGCPVVVNTSFNVRGEPIVCSPKDAYECFMRTNLDALVVGSFLLQKTDQPVPGGGHQLQSRIPGRLSPAEGRRFGFSVGFTFLVVSSLLTFWQHREFAGAFAGAVGALFVLAGLLIPHQLGRVHHLWMGLAYLSSRVITPALMSMVYILLIIPIAAVMRIVGRRPLVHGEQNGGDWVSPISGGRSNMKHQF